MARFEDSCAITGIGMSQVGRHLGRGGLDLTLEAAHAALRDAGLTPAEVDGLATWPGTGVPGGGATPFSGPGTWEVQDAMRLALNWHTGSGMEGPGQLGALLSACLAVSAGLARHVLVYRTTTEASGRRVPKEPQRETGGWAQWSQPFGGHSGANRVALQASRHFHDFGTTREQLGMLAVTQRYNAGLNDRAVYRDPLTVADYLDARMISTPLCLLDCDVPVDGSTAVVVSHRDTARDSRRPAVGFDAFGSALTGRASWDQWGGHEDHASFGAARSLWNRTDLSPADVDVAQLYDGFSWSALIWLEALGFCGTGEGGTFLEGGKRIALDGELPLNTGGGQLSAGRLSGFGLVHEAVLQLRGDGGDRQVANSPEVALVSNGAGFIAGCMTLTRLN
ncbi:hypothetical protein GCM10009836_44240 [Pseudonocardia ailaonensis]|uniref:Thiolase C-terminal domain-containing protein n=1 Tax=Pseudonocardia ailaonensis TaxID=367279 RepID=A0ABN2N9K7_9PSEU